MSEGRLDWMYMCEHHPLGDDQSMRLNEVHREPLVLQVLSALVQACPATYIKLALCGACFVCSLLFHRSKVSALS